ncbi:MAG: alanine--tRNA ligase, partial [Candidatus Omnitrophica bacterium]|nr:alanine--tRNA ligase [Candidatus Omnitrophota bacterium]
MKADLLRKKFLEFFAGKKHKIVVSDSLVPAGDPTVLFTSAGMNQFKKQFLGQITDFRRAASSQKCLRTDDLDKVGQTPFHHTFFEMLGNFSFGDYFKKEAIAWAWEFLTEWLKIPQDKLWVSVYKEDDEAYQIWLKDIKIGKDKIVKLGDKENFWPSEAKQKGPNGPCGPCSEIFYDYGKDIGCGKKDCDPACSCGRFAEIWNLVFTQFNRKEGGSLEPLPNRNIDTGMGLERLAAVMQGVKSNFETDLFEPIVKEIVKEAGRSPNLKIVYVVADHIRAMSFAILDGVLPSNDNRGYVVRKLIRRGVNNCRQIGIKKAFLYKLVSVVSEVMKEPYPELLDRRENIAAIIKREEESFWNVLKETEPKMISSFELFRKELKSTSELAKKVAEFAFELHDTYGYPKEMTQNFAKDNNVPFDEKYFDVLMQEQKQRSKSASSMAGDVFVDAEIKGDLEATEFVGYETMEEKSKILKIFDQENNEVKTTKGLKTAKIILDKTPFYAESGGQICDKGIISQDKDAKLEVIDVKKIHQSIIHICSSIKGEFKVGDKVNAEVDIERRLAIARNHTATHLLQAALRKVLGEHVQQQGSLVAEDRLRFDFTHFKQLTKEELSRVEELVNEYIINNDALKVEEKSTTQAKKEGALAFFAEKYADKSRVVKIGAHSKELCGGTHLKATGQIGLFKILSEGSVAQGI